MATKTIDVGDPQIQLAEVLSLLAEGNEVILTDGAKPLARVVPLNGEGERARRVPDLFPGAVWMSEDFDEPLPDEFWVGNE